MERRLRLRREAEVQAVRSRGRAYAEGPLVARVLANGSDPPANRYAVIAGKKVGSAVARNRAKRIVREALRHLHPSLAVGYDVAVIVRGTSEELPDYATARRALERTLRRAGLLPPAAAAPGGPAGQLGSGAPGATASA